MNKFVFLLAALLLMLSLTACEGMFISKRKYQEIAGYVLENQETLSPKQNAEFYTYDTSGLAVGGVYYGYYYSAENEIAAPDFYSSIVVKDPVEADNGIYFGEPNTGTDWYYIRNITDQWYYYELHCG